MSKSTVRFTLNMSGLNELMKSGEMQDVLRDAATQVARAAGTDYASDVHTASFVAIGTAFPDSARAAHENYEKNTLLKALQSTGLPMSKGK